MKCDELKSFIVLYNGKFERVYEENKVDAAIAELKEFAENACLERDDNQTAIDELNEENHRLKRALWLARANNAESQFLYWCARFGVESGFTKVDIRGYSVNTKRRLRTIGEWIEKWKNVKSKCRAKAEECK